MPSCISKFVAYDWCQQLTCRRGMTKIIPPFLVQNVCSCKRVTWRGCNSSECTWWLINLLSFSSLSEWMGLASGFALSVAQVARRDIWQGYKHARTQNSVGRMWLSSQCQPWLLPFFPEVGQFKLKGQFKLSDLAQYKAASSESLSLETSCSNIQEF